jgi:hypothetical protein
VRFIPAVANMGRRGKNWRFIPKFHSILDFFIPKVTTTLIDIGISIYQFSFYFGRLEEMNEINGLFIPFSFHSSIPALPQCLCVAVHQRWLIRETGYQGGVHAGISEGMPLLTEVLECLVIFNTSCFTLTTHCHKGESQ